MRLQGHMLEPIVEFINELELTLADSIVRDDFLSSISDVLIEYQTDKEKLFREYLQEGKQDGEDIVFEYKEGIDPKIFEKEYSKVLMQDYVFSVPTEIKKELADLLLQSDTKLTGSKASILIELIKQLKGQ